jgi:hypothetical protein
MEVCSVPGYLLRSAAALAIGGRTMLLADHNASHTQWLATVLSGWRILTAFSFHTNLNDQDQFDEEHGIAAGFLVLAEDGRREGEKGRAWTCGRIE